MKAMKKLLVLFLALATVFALAAIPAFAAEDGYTDVNEKDWFAGAVEYAAENGLMNGVGDNKFAPADSSTRAMVVTILHRLDGEPKSTNEVKFDDLTADWYKAAVAWANENGIVKGYSETKFGPNDLITREQLATMTYRYAVEYLGLDGTAAGDLKAFPDADKVQDWAKDAMVWAVGEGLITGTKVGDKVYLDPQSSANRAQLATILMRLDQNVVTHTHNLEYTAAVEATCHQNGMQEYWYCADCDCYFSDAEGKYNVAYLRLTIPATVGLTYVPAAEACHVPGINEYWYCTECEAVYADAEGKVLTNRKRLEIEPDTKLTYSEAVEPCHLPGYYEYWYCEECDSVYADEEGTQKTNRMNLQIAPDNTLVHTDAVDATCHGRGNVEYWHCEECNGFYLDEKGMQVTNALSIWTPEKGSEKLEAVAAVKPACYTNGNVAYWYCPECDGYFLDAACTQVSNKLSVILPAGHVNNDVECTICGWAIGSEKNPIDVIVPEDLLSIELEAGETVYYKLNCGLYDQGLFLNIENKNMGIAVTVDEVELGDRNIEWVDRVTCYYVVELDESDSDVLVSVTNNSDEDLVEDDAVIAYIKTAPGTEGNPVVVTNGSAYVETEPKKPFYIVGRVDGTTLRLYSYDKDTMKVTVGGTEVELKENEKLGGYTYEIPENKEALNAMTTVTIEAKNGFNGDVEFISLGSWDMPEELTSLESFKVSIEAGNEYGYYYTLTATKPGTLTITAKDYVVGKYDVELTADSTWSMPMMSSNDEDADAKGTVSIEVVENDVVKIHVIAIPEIDEDWNRTFNAVDVTLTGTFVEAPAAE